MCVCVCVCVFECTSAQSEGIVLHFAEVAVHAVKAELPPVTMVTAAPAVPSASSVAVTHPISVTRSVGAPDTGFRETRMLAQTQLQHQRFLFNSLVH